MGFCTACAVDAFGIEPEWIEIVENDLPLRTLPKGFTGLRVVQISDLHLSMTVSEKYLRRCIQRVNGLNPDIVVLTGDYVTLGLKDRYKERVVEIMGDICAKRGVYACLGNHDYGISARWQQGRDELLNYLTEGMKSHNIRVLRNGHEAITVGDETIYLVGLGDLWADDLKVAEAFRGVPDEATRILLVHNPDSIDHLGAVSPDAMLCGHTHGGQVKMPFLGPPILPVKNRQYYAGLYEVGETKMYINRGLGRLGRVRFNCRPEITVHTLQRPA